MEQQQAQQPASEQEGSGDKVVEMMKKFQDFLGQLQGVAPKIFPPEAQKALEAASQAYGQFLSIAMGGAQAPQPPQDSMAAGRQAVPADQPMRPGAQPA